MFDFIYYFFLFVDLSEANLHWKKTNSKKKNRYFVKNSWEIINLAGDFKENTLLL